MYDIYVNGKHYRIDALPDTPLLWILREDIGLLGTKYSCGEGLCGSCTVLIDGDPTPSCVTPIKLANGSRITTIEGIAGQKDHPLIKAWLVENVSQCGFCQPGQIMTAVALLDKNPNPSDLEITDAMDSNYCRCGTYQRIRRAIRRASNEIMAKESR